MKMINRWIINALLFTLVTLSPIANAELISRLGGLAYYDSVTNLTWLANANTARTRMYWVEANTWAENLDIAGITDWRLPITDSSCAGSYCKGSEMGDLFYRVLRGSEYNSIDTIHGDNFASSEKFVGSFRYG